MAVSGGDRGDDSPLSDATISFRTLLDMLRRENDLRLSPALQQQYREQGYEAYVPITEALQRQVAGEFGLDPVEGVAYLQGAESLVRGDEARLRAVREASLYRKYNRCFDGPLDVGDPAPRLVLPLWRLNGEQSVAEPCDTFNECLAASFSKPLVVIAGSYS